MYPTKIILYCLIFFSPKVSAFDTFEVDWPERKPGQDYHILAVTIDGCETRFNIKNEELYSAMRKEDAMNQAVDKAIARAEKGCH